MSVGALFGLFLAVWLVAASASGQQASRPANYAIRAMFDPRVDVEYRGVEFVVGVVGLGGQRLIAHGAFCRCHVPARAGGVRSLVGRDEEDCYLEETDSIQGCAGWEAGIRTPIRAC
jgi:hypothetical protein